MTPKIATIMCIVMILGIDYATAASDQSAERSKKDLLRVGVYDSRAIALAYESKYSKNNLQKMQTALEQARKNVDTQKIKELMAQAQERQLKSNWQGMGIAPVHECFEPIRDKIPTIVQQAGVDILINKWSMDYASHDADFVDLTDELVTLFNPDKGTLKWIESLKGTPPLNVQLGLPPVSLNKKTPNNNKDQTMVQKNTPHAIVTKDAAEFQFVIDNVSQKWQWDDTYDMALEYAWWVEIPLSGKVYTVGYSHFQGPGSTAQQGYLQELLITGQVDVWDQGRSILRGKGLKAEVNESGILIRLTNSKFLNLIISERPEIVIFKSEGQQLKKNNKHKREEVAVQYQLNN